MATEVNHRIAVSLLRLVVIPVAPDHFILRQTQIRTYQTTHRCQGEQVETGEIVMIGVKGEAGIGMTGIGGMIGIGIGGLGRGAGVRLLGREVVVVLVGEGKELGILRREIWRAGRGILIVDDE